MSILFFLRSCSSQKTVLYLHTVEKMSLFTLLPFEIHGYLSAPSHVIWTLASLSLLLPISSFSELVLILVIFMNHSLCCLRCSLKQAHREPCWFGNREVSVKELYILITSILIKSIWFSFWAKFSFSHTIRGGENFQSGSREPLPFTVRV